jgi:hypothetical protein
VSCEAQTECLCHLDESMHKMVEQMHLFAFSTRLLVFLSPREEYRHSTARPQLRLSAPSLHINKQSCPFNRPWRPIGLWDVKDPTLSRQSAHS